METEGELVSKNDADVLNENRKLLEEKSSLEYELSKLVCMNLKKPSLMSKIDKVQKIEDHIKMKENQEIVSLIKQINLYNFKITEKCTEENLIDQKEIEFVEHIRHECLKKEKNILALKRKLAITTDKKIALSTGKEFYPSNGLGEASLGATRSQFSFVNGPGSGNQQPANVPYNFKKVDNQQFVAADSSNGFGVGGSELARSLPGVGSTSGVKGGSLNQSAFKKNES